MSATMIASCNRSASLPLVRVFSKHRPSHFDSKTSLLKSTYGSESDGEYETSSEGRQLSRQETHPQLYGAFESSITKINDTISKPEVTPKLRLEVVDESTKKSENSTKVEDSFNSIKDLSSPEVNPSEMQVVSIENRSQLNPSFIRPIFSSEIDRSSSDSRQTLQSIGTKSRLALSTAKTSTTDLQNIYMQKEYQTQSIGSNSLSELKDRFEFEKENRLESRNEMDFLKSIGK